MILKKKKNRNESTRIIKQKSYELERLNGY